MLLREALITLRRRWIVLLVGFLVAGATGSWAFVTVGPEHEARSVSVLVPPATTTARGEGDYTQGNPLFYLSGLTQPRDLVINKVRTGDFATEFERLHPDVEYEVSHDPGSSGPIILVSAVARDERTALVAMHDLTRQLSVALVDLQQSLGIEEKARITVYEVTSDTETKIQRGGQLRAAIAVGAGLVTATLLLVALLEGLSRPRRMR